MIYVMSDIHGEYFKYREMLDKIHFSDSDTMYILGDLMDRGDYPIELVTDIIKRKNVTVIKGNHDVFAQKYLPPIYYDEGKYSQYELTEIYISAGYWKSRNGGDKTIKAFGKLDERDMRKIIGFIEKMPLYKEIDVNGIHYIMVHAGLKDFVPGMDISAYSEHDLVWTRPDFDERIFDDDKTKIIVGHTPTIMINSQPDIYHGKSYICIDCGAVYPQGRLSCLCLDDGSEYYVD